MTFKDHKFKVGDEVIINDCMGSNNILGKISEVKITGYHYRVAHKDSQKEGELFFEHDLRPLTPLEKAML